MRIYRTRNLIGRVIRYGFFLLNLMLNPKPLLSLSPALQPGLRLGIFMSRPPLALFPAIPPTDLSAIAVPPKALAAQRKTDPTANTPDLQSTNRDTLRLKDGLDEQYRNRLGWPSVFWNGDIPVHKLGESTHGSPIPTYQEY